MVTYNPFVSIGSANEAQAMLKTLRDLLQHEEISINTDKLEISVIKEDSNNTHRYIVENGSRSSMLENIDQILPRLTTFAITDTITDRYATINGSFSFLNYNGMLPLLKNGLNVKSFHVIRTVDNFVNGVEFNLKFEECSNIPNRVKKIEGKDLGKINKVILLGKIMEEDNAVELFKKNGQHIVTYEGIVKNYSCTELDLTSLLDMGYTTTSYTDLRLCSSVFAEGETLYIPLSYLSIESLPHLIYELGWIVQRINAINVNVSKSWYFIPETNTLESLETLAFHKQDYLKAEALLEERLRLLREDMALLDEEIKAINIAPKNMVVKPDNSEISFMYSAGDTTLVLSTKQILVHDDKIDGVIYNLGALDILLSKGNNAPQFINKQQMIKGSHVPHANGSTLCLGNIRDDVYNLMTTNKDIEFLSDYLINFLKHPNSADPWGGKIRFFPVINTNDIDDKNLILLNMIRVSDLSHSKCQQLIRKNNEIMLSKKDISPDETAFINNLSELLMSNPTDLIDYCSSQKIDSPIYEIDYNIFLLLIREEAISYIYNDFDKFTDKQRMKALNVRENKRDYNYIMEKQDDNNISISSEES